ncbi:MAG: response regulator transcription factor [Candidatus Eremiobacteraeota bacterium]|nr:response regulator transcription factor [Candidatus Eremiobacteraeota bacterium]
MAKEKILVVDDERNIVELLKYNLEKEGYEVISAYDGFEAVNLAKQDRPDLIILDIMLPGQGGLEVCRILRKETKIPIIMATAKGEEIDKILGLELGADDYVTKPFSPRELVARVKAVLRRTSSKAEEKDELAFEDLTLNLVKHEVRLKGNEVDLKPKEFDLLKLLATNPGKVFTRDFLLEQLWGYDYLGDTRTVDVHMRRLRQKIEEDAANPRFLKTVHGIGYKFQYEEKE